MKIWNIGYPRVGHKNRWGIALREWEGSETNSQALLEKATEVLQERWKSQHDLGVDSIPLNDFSFWDPVLETAWLFNLFNPKGIEGKDWLSSQFCLAGALQQKSWFRSGYQYCQPEWDGKTALSLNRQKLDWELQNQKKVPYLFHVTLLGPWTVASLTKIQGATKAELLRELGPLYLSLLKDLKKKGFNWAVLEEPAFCGDLQKEDIKTISSIYDSFGGGIPKIVISTYYESPDPWLSELSQLPVQGFHYDLVAGPAVLSWIKTRSFPKDKLLGLGLVNGTNIWASSVSSLFKQIEILKGFHPTEKMFLAPSCPLFHLPLTKDIETGLKDNKGLFDNISFANERLEELSLLKHMILGSISVSEVESQEKKRHVGLASFQQKSESVRNQMQRLDPSDRKRTSSFAKRIKIQAKRLNLPKLPISLCQYPLEPSVQKELGVDVACEPLSTYERTLNDYTNRWTGFINTENGWVQKSSFLTIKPPLLVSDVEWKERKEPLTPQKACVLGPNSIVNLSFCRQDISKETLLTQTGLAARSETKAFEKAGVVIIQLDEPALSDYIPLKKQKCPPLLKQALESLKIATSGVKDDTHLQLNIDSCELEVVTDLLQKVDVDVLHVSSRGNVVERLRQVKMSNIECGLSMSVVPSAEFGVISLKEIDLNIRRCFEVIAPDRLWISVDIPVKKISEPAAKSTIERLVEVTRIIRRLLNGSA